MLLSDRIVMMTNGPAATIGEHPRRGPAAPARAPRSSPTNPRYIECRREVLEFLYTRQAVKAA